MAPRAKRSSYGLPQEVRPDHYADDDFPPCQLGEGHCEQPSNESDCYRDSTRRTAASLVMFRHVSTSGFSNSSRPQFIAGSASCSTPQHCHSNTVSSSTVRRHGIALPWKRGLKIRTDTNVSWRLHEQMGHFRYMEVSGNDCRDVRSNRYQYEGAPCSSPSRTQTRRKELPIIV